MPVLALIQEAEKLRLDEAYEIILLQCNNNANDEKLNGCSLLESKSKIHSFYNTYLVGEVWKCPYSMTLVRNGSKNNK